MSRLLQGLKQGLTKYPILTNSAIFGTMFVGAECVNQTISKKIIADVRQPYDPEHIMRCGVFGTAVQGPAMTVWYRWLDSKFVGTTLKVVSRKILFDQFLFTPNLYVFFYVFMSLMERKENVLHELIQKFPQTFASSCVFWIPVQALNFALVPPIYRVTYMGAAAFVWVTILCWIKSQKYEK